MSSRTPIPYTGKRKKHNPERRTWRGLSHRRCGRGGPMRARRVRELRYEMLAKNP